MVRGILSVLLLVPFISCATTTVKPKLDDVLSKADQVLHVRILSSNVESFRFDGRIETCGILYRAKIIESENSDEITFASRSSLAANEEYLVAAGKGDYELPAGSRWLEQPDYLESSTYKTCREKLPELQAEKIYRFVDYSRNQDGSPSWLISDADDPVLAEQIKTVKLQCEADDCERISEPVLINWESLKRYIQKPRP